MKYPLSILWGILCAVLLLLLLRLTAPLFAPFLPALAAAALIEPAVSGMCRRGVRRSIASALVTTAVLGLCLGTVLFCLAGSTGLVTAYAQKVPQLLTLLTDTTHSFRHALDRLLSSMPREAASGLSVMLDGLSTQLQTLPGLVSRQALQHMTDLAKASPDGLLFVCTAVIGVYFFSLYYKDIGTFFRRQLSEATAIRLSMVWKVLREAVGGYVKVQCILSSVTFLILLSAFSLMNLENSISAAAAIADFGCRSSAAAMGADCPALGANPPCHSPAAGIRAAACGTQRTAGKAHGQPIGAAPHRRTDLPVCRLAAGRSVGHDWSAADLRGIEQSEQQRFYSPLSIKRSSIPQGTEDRFYGNHFSCWTAV